MSFFKCGVFTGSHPHQWMRLEKIVWKNTVSARDLEYEIKIFKKQNQVGPKAIFELVRPKAIFVFGPGQSRLIWAGPGQPGPGRAGLSRARPGPGGAGPCQACAGLGRARRFSGLWRAVAGCDGLWRAVAACQDRLAAPIETFSWKSRTGGMMMG